MNAAERRMLTELGKNTCRRLAESERSRWLTMRAIGGNTSYGGNLDDPTDSRFSRAALKSLLAKGWVILRNETQGSYPEKFYGLTDHGYEKYCALVGKGPESITIEEYEMTRAKASNPPATPEQLIAAITSLMHDSDDRPMWREYLADRLEAIAESDHFTSLDDAQIPSEAKEAFTTLVKTRSSTDLDIDSSAQFQEVNAALARLDSATRNAFLKAYAAELRRS